ncbi:hypothetical protein sS8_2572 [Methylocaldum marinum]|uniref:Uncharacterized protein n=1 Tax=Methylocaldum marinum TaxID=1432792 RepID=A0A250KS67_9GAMM|nr:hypothetical protein sS8_2572 [Methylocaldum marinum]
MTISFPQLPRHIPFSVRESKLSSLLLKPLHTNKRFSFEFISHSPHSLTPSGTGDDPMRSGRFGVVLLWATVALADDDGKRAARVIREVEALTR